MSLALVVESGRDFERISVVLRQAKPFAMERLSEPSVSGDRRDVARMVRSHRLGFRFHPATFDYKKFARLAFVVVFYRNTEAAAPVVLFGLVVSSSARIFATRNRIVGARPLREPVY